MANPLEALAVVNQHIRRERDHSITGEGAVCNKRKACTSIADLTDDNLCQILNLLPIEDRCETPVVPPYRPLPLAKPAWARPA